VNGERQRRISAALGHPDKAASELLDALIRSLGMPRTLREVGVDESQFPLIAEYALEDMWGRTNPRPIQSVDDVIEVLNLALG
jgi:alcohol dehydrogenase class IV